MYDKEKTITIEVTLKYSFDSELEEIKELINRLVNLKGFDFIEINNKN